MTYGDLFDQVREDFDEYIEALPDNESVSIDDDVEDAEDVVSELCSFLMRRTRERENE